MKILISGHEIQVRRALRYLIEQEKRIEVIGDVSSAEQIIDKNQQLKPDIILLDWELEGLNPEMLLDELKDNDSSPFVVALSGNPGIKQKVLELGVDAFTSRWERPQEILDVISQFME